MDDILYVGTDLFSQLQKELDTNLHLPASVTTEEKKTQTPKTTKVFLFLIQSFISQRVGS